MPDPWLELEEQEPNEFDEEELGGEGLDEEPSDLDARAQRIA